MSDLPTLTVRQPWADLILMGVKDVENRTWRTGHRGTLLIHSAKKVDWWALEYVKSEFGVSWPPDYEPRTGVLLGSVELADCVTEHPSPFFTGPYGFTLRRPRALDWPVPYRGRLGIYRVPAELVQGNRPAAPIPGSPLTAAAGGHLSLGS